VKFFDREQAFALPSFYTPPRALDSTYRLSHYSSLQSCSSSSYLDDPHAVGSCPAAALLVATLDNYTLMKRKANPASFLRRREEDTFVSFFVFLESWSKTWQ
jgi:hypothetical protein